MKSLSKRAIININFPALELYATVDIMKVAANFPAASDFAGPYVIKWTGAAGTFIFNYGPPSFTIDAGQSTSFSKTFPDRFFASTSNPRIVYSFDAGEAIRANGDIRPPVDNVSIYRLSDETDFLAGKFFRTAYLQVFVDYYPSASRVLDWFGGVDSQLMRWEDRSLLSDKWWSGNVRCGTVANPSGRHVMYGTTSGANIYTLSAIGSTPASEKHGHIVQCTIGSGMVRGGSNTVTGVTRANPGVATYSGADNYQNGDKVIFEVVAGMTQLHQRICTVANVNTGANTFELSGLDTSSFSAWGSGSVKQYVSLSVGTWAAYPVIFSDTTQASQFGSAYIASNDIKTFYFDKGLVAAKDEATGTPIQGAWIFNNLGSLNYHRVGLPPAVLIQFCTELNQLAIASGKSGPIDLWVNIPQRGMLSMDPDYDPSSNVAIGLVGLFFNGGDGVAAAPSNVKLFVELSDEPWNSAGGFTCYWDFVARGRLRWGFSGSNPRPWWTLRHAVMVSDIRSAFPSHLDRIIFVQGGQGTLGVTSTNVALMTGVDSDVDVTADPLFISCGGGTPKDYFDAFAIASYFDTPTSFDNANLTTLTAAWKNGDAAAKDQAITDYLVGVGSGSGETIIRYRDTLLPAYNTKMIELDRVVIGYEGANQFILNGTKDDRYNFLWAVRSSRQWANLYRTWFDKWMALSNAAMPGEYISVQSTTTDHRWDHVSAGLSDTYLNGVEGAGLDQAFGMQCISGFNNRKRRLRVS